MTEEKYDQQTIFMMRKSDKEFLKQYAKAHNIAMSEIIRLAIAEVIDEARRMKE